jgi:hypothetical protein
MILLLLCLTVDVAVIWYVAETAPQDVPSGLWEWAQALS